MSRLSRNRHVTLLMLVAMLMAPMQALASVYSTPSPHHHLIAGHHCDSAGQDGGHKCHPQHEQFMSMQGSHCEGGQDCQLTCDNCTHCQYCIPQMSVDNYIPHGSLLAATEFDFLSHTPDADLRPPRHG